MPSSSPVLLLPAAAHQSSRQMLVVQAPAAHVTDPDGVSALAGAGGYLGTKPLGWMLLSVCPSLPFK